MNRYVTPGDVAYPFLNNSLFFCILKTELQNSLTLRQSLLSVTLRREIDVFSTEEPAMDLLAQKERLRCFPWRTKSMDLKLLSEDTLHRRAKRINLCYAHLYQEVKETEENMEAEWRKLDPFTRYSNVSTADYHELRLKLLKAQGLSDQADVFPFRIWKRWQNWNTFAGAAIII